MKFGTEYGIDMDVKYRHPILEFWSSSALNTKARYKKQSSAP